MKTKEQIEFKISELTRQIDSDTKKMNSIESELGRDRYFMSFKKARAKARAKRQSLEWVLKP